MPKRVRERIKTMSKSTYIKTIKITDNFVKKLKNHQKQNIARRKKRPFERTFCCAEKNVQIMWRHPVWQSAAGPSSVVDCDGRQRFSGLAKKNKI